MPNCADVIGSLKLVEIPAQRHLCRLSPLIHTARLVLLNTIEYALEMLLWLLSMFECGVDRRGWKVTPDTVSRVSTVPAN
jgi:hypothetical protein